MKKIILITGLVILIQPNICFSIIDIGFGGIIDDSLVLPQAEVAPDESDSELDFDSAIEILNNTADNLDLADQAISAINYLSQNLETFTPEQIEQIPPLLNNIEESIIEEKKGYFGELPNNLQELRSKVVSLQDQIQALPTPEPEKPDLNQLGNEELIELLEEESQDSEKVQDIVKELQNRNYNNQLTSDNKVALFEVLANREIKLGDDYRDFVVELAKQYTLQAIADEPELSERQDLVNKVLDDIAKILGRADEGIRTEILKTAGLDTAEQVVTHQKPSDETLDDLNEAIRTLRESDYSLEQGLSAFSTLIAIALSDSEAKERALDFIRDFVNGILSSQDLNSVEPEKVFLALTGLEMLKIRLNAGEQRDSKLMSEVDSLLSELQNRIFDSESGYDIEPLFSLARDLYMRRDSLGNFTASQATVLVFTELLPTYTKLTTQATERAQEGFGNKDGESPAEDIMSLYARRFFSVPLGSSEGGRGGANEGFLNRLGQIMAGWDSKTTQAVGRGLAELYRTSPETAILAGEALGFASSFMPDSRRDAFVTNLSQGISSYTPGGDFSDPSSISGALIQAVEAGAEVGASSLNSLPLSPELSPLSHFVSGKGEEGTETSPSETSPLSHFVSGKEGEGKITTLAISSLEEEENTDINTKITSSGFRGGSNSDSSADSILFSSEAELIPGFTLLSHFVSGKGEEGHYSHLEYEIKNMNLSEYQELIQQIKENPEFLFLIAERFHIIAEMIANLNLSDLEVEINLASLSLTHLNLLNYYSTLLVQNSLYYFIQILFKDLSKIGNLKDLSLDLNLDSDKFIDFLSPEVVIKEILKKLQPKRIQENARLKIVFPLFIPLKEFIVLILCLSLFSIVLGRAIGRHYLLSIARRDNSGTVSP